MFVDWGEVSGVFGVFEVNAFDGAICIVVVDGAGAGDAGRGEAPT